MCQRHQGDTTRALASASQRAARSYLSPRISLTQSNTTKQETFKRLGLSIMGTTSSKLEKSLPSSFPESERLFGLENVSCPVLRVGEDHATRADLRGADNLMMILSLPLFTLIPASRISPAISRDPAH